MLPWDNAQANFDAQRQSGDLTYDLLRSQKELSSILHMYGHRTRGLEESAKLLGGAYAVFEFRQLITIEALQEVAVGLCNLLRPGQALAQIQVLLNELSTSELVTEQMLCRTREIEAVALFQLGYYQIAMQLENEVLEFLERLVPDDSPTFMSDQRSIRLARARAQHIYGGMLLAHALMGRETTMSSAQDWLTLSREEELDLALRIKLDALEIIEADNLAYTERKKIICHDLVQIFFHMGKYKSALEYQDSIIQAKCNFDRMADWYLEWFEVANLLVIARMGNIEIPEQYSLSEMKRGLQEFLVDQYGIKLDEYMESTSELLRDSAIGLVDDQRFEIETGNSFAEFVKKCAELSGFTHDEINSAAQRLSRLLTDSSGDGKTWTNNPNVRNNDFHKFHDLGVDQAWNIEVFTRARNVGIVLNLEPTLRVKLDTYVSTMSELKDDFTKLKMRKAEAFNKSWQGE